MPTLDVTELAELGQQLRVDSVRCSAAANSGHPINWRPTGEGQDPVLR